MNFIQRLGVPMARSLPQYVVALRKFSDDIVPEIGSKDDLKVCFDIGRKFTYQAASQLDATLGKRAREIVTDMGFLSHRSKKKDGLDVITETFNRHDYDSFDQTELLWTNRVQELIDEGVLENREGTPNPVLSAKKESALKDPQSIKNINMSIKNVATMLLIRDGVLYRES